MKILFDEVSYIENMLVKGFGKHISINDLKLLAKYYLYKGSDHSEIKNKLIEFCKNFDPVYNEILWENKINLAYKNYRKESIIIPVQIDITKKEMERIRSINNYKYEKVLFVMIVLAKFKNNSKNKTNGTYYASTLPPPIFKIARVSANVKEQNKTTYFLKENGFLLPTKVYSGFELCCIDNEYDQDDIAISINNYTDVISFYPPYCKLCGKPLEKRSSHHQMHKECWKEKRIIDKRNENRF